MTTQTDAFAAAVAALAEAVRAASVSPADQVRSLTTLAAFSPAGTAGTGPIGQVMAVVRSAVGSLCRRAALISLCRAAAAYQPTSYTDAATLRESICCLLDREITASGDAGDDGAYLALRALRSAVVQDLTARGASLAPLVTVTTRAPMPALALAWTLYQDAAREGDLAARSDAPHPAFLPTSLQVLAS